VLTAEMINAYPREMNLDRELVTRCVEACFECAQTCTACADACLSEEQVAQLVKCIRTDLDCADICDTTGRVLSRHTEYDANITRAMVQACAVACKACGDECESHAGHHEHCRVCAEACRRCERVCNEVLAAIG
jgi:hypothetical protein